MTIAIGLSNPTVFMFYAQEFSSSQIIPPGPEPEPTPPSPDPNPTPSYGRYVPVGGFKAYLLGRKIR